MELEKETALVETVLFLESEPVSEKTISHAAELSEEVVRVCLENLKEKYGAENSGIELGMITGGWCLMPKKEFWNVLRERYGEKTAYLFKVLCSETKISSISCSSCCLFLIPSDIKVSFSSVCEHHRILQQRIFAGEYEACFAGLFYVPSKTDYAGLPCV